MELITPVEAEMTPQPDGSLLLRNKISLADYPANLAFFLRESAARFPDKPFLLERSGEGWRGITYSETLARTNRLSNGLLGLGLEANAPIAVLSPNSIDMALVQLAAMQIGCPAVPISLAYSLRSQTGDLVKHILDVTSAPVLVMSDAEAHMTKVERTNDSGRSYYAFRNSEAHHKVRDFAELYAAAENLSPDAESRFSAVTPDTIAKIQFTSGSTNLPKGVEVTHRMMTSNQVSIRQLWPFLSSEDVLVDWLPWNHTFGGNFVFNAALAHGATLHIDNGNPTPAGFANTVTNIISVKPTLYFGVPASYAALYARMQEDTALRKAFFARLRLIFVAAAALDQKTFQGMRAMAKRETGMDIPFFSAWGSTETAPCAMLVYWRTDDIRVIGLPNPGTTLKLVPCDTHRYEARVTGANVSKGYFDNHEATDAAFDDDGYYCTGDAVAFLDNQNPNAGLIFAGRLGEDFKLTSGTWVHNAEVRASLNEIGKPYLMEVVLAAPDRPYLNALVVPNVAALRGHFTELSDTHTDDAELLHSSDVIALFHNFMQEHNRERTASSQRIVRFTVLTRPLQFDQGEATDKGYINQGAVLRNNAELVARLYESELAEGVWEVCN